MYDPKPEDLRAKNAKDTLDKVEQAVSQFVRQQQVINELKRISGCDKDNA